MNESVSVNAAGSGALVYDVRVPPERLPVVARRDLLAAWTAAHDAAHAARWGEPRAVRFRRRDGSVTELIIADADARCWAAAVDSTVGLDHVYGMAICFRLLALIELMARAPWLRGFFDIAPDGEVALHPALVSAAARQPLSADGRFDEAPLRRLFAARLPGAPA